MIYMGSKNRIAKQIKPIIESAINGDTASYIEPFVGGGNMIDKIETAPWVRKIGYDADKYAIAVLQGLRDGKVPPMEVSRDLYMDVKNNREKYDDFTIGYVGYQVSFGGKFFGGYAKRDDNKSRGDIYSYKHCMKQAPLLEGIEFAVSDFRRIEVPRNSVVYCDPPYRGVTEYKHLEEFPYEEFYDWCREIGKHSTVFVSEYWMPDDFKQVWQKNVKVTLEATQDGIGRTERLYRI